jgi:hypothetical protein
MENLVRVHAPNGKSYNITFENISEVTFKAQVEGHISPSITQDEVLRRNKTVKFEVSNDIPKAQLKQLQDSVANFGIDKGNISKVDNITWYKSGAGRGTALDSVEAMQEKGFIGVDLDSWENFLKSQVELITKNKEGKSAQVQWECAITLVKNTESFLNDNMSIGKTSFAIPNRNKSQEGEKKDEPKAESITEEA